MELFEDLKALITATEKDVVKFYVDKNALAGRRVRKNLQNIKMICQQMREEIQEIKKGE